MPQVRGNNGLQGIVLGSLVAYGFYRLVLKPNMVQPVRLKNYVSRIRINIPAVRFKGDNVEFDVYIQNPNPDPINISAIVGDVFVSYGGKMTKIGNLDRYGTTVIKPTAETKFTFQVRLKFLPMVAYFNDLYAGKARGQVLTFKGTITVDGRPWTIKESVKIT